MSYAGKRNENNSAKQRICNMSNYFHIPVPVIVNNYFRRAEFAFATKRGKIFNVIYFKLLKSEATENFH
jgi:hypothetical protein